MKERAKHQLLEYCLKPHPFPDVLQGRCYCMSLRFRTAVSFEPGGMVVTIIVTLKQQEATLIIDIHEAQSYAPRSKDDDVLQTDAQ